MNINEVSKRDPKAEVVGGCKKAFLGKGYQATSIRDIARAYGCRPANIYNFFRQRGDVV